MHVANFLKVRRRGLFVNGILRILFAFLLAVLLYAVLDYFLALGTTTRILASGLLVFAVGAFTVRELLAASKCRDDDIARLSDELSESRRHPVLTALELLKESDTTKREGINSLLVRRSIEEANIVLAGTEARGLLPRNELRRNGTRAGIAAAGLIGAAILFSAVASVLIPRLTLPWRDTPPYSPLTFKITPETPEIYYGEDAVIEATIEGGEISGPVRFLTRHASAGNAEVFETTCFQDGPNRFAQKLEKVTQDTEFAFASGKARSRWHSVDLLLEPKIALGSVTVTPPDYAGLPAKTFLIGEQPLAVLRGSRVQLAITSNRPLASGDLHLSPLETEEEPGAGITGVNTGLQSITFEWIAEKDSSAKIEIRDVRGTPNRIPYTISQRIIPDTPPKITLEKPAIHLMATPSIKVPIQARAEDDLGLARVEIVRTVVGFRDRNERIGPSLPGGQEKRFEYDSHMNLAELGVAPGETLEVYFQAVDQNPSLLGLAASEVSRIQIISDEEYANMIRTRTTIEEFAARFRIVNEALNDVAAELESLQQTLKTGDEEAITEARKNAALAAAKAEDFFRMLSKDFKAFDLEEAAIRHSKETLRQIESIRQQLMPSGTDLSEADISKMLKELNRNRAEYQEQEGRAKQVAAVSELMQKAVEFSHLVRDQDTLTRRLKKFEAETRTSSLPFLKMLGAEQEQLRKRLDSLARELDQSIEALPAGYDDLRTSAEAFSRAIQHSGAAGEMEISSTAATNDEGARSYQYSSLALEKLNAILSGENQEAGQFGQLASGKLNFSVPAPLQKTLSEMLSALCLGMGQGNRPGPPGSGSGGSGGGNGGFGGNSDDGYSMAGYTALDIPVLGPPRMKLDSPPPSQTGGEENGSGRGDGTPRNADEQDRHESGQSTVPDSSSLDLERVPEKYRDAVKRFFSPDELPTETKETP